MSTYLGFAEQEKKAAEQENVRLIFFLELETKTLPGSGFIFFFNRQICNLFFCVSGFKKEAFIFTFWFSDGFSPFSKFYF